MKIKGIKPSKRTVALLAATILLLSSGGIMGTNAALNITTEGDRAYDATIATDRLSVQLIENGEELDDEATLFAELQESGVEPGMPYKETIGVKNNGQAAEYIRVVVRKYWTDPDGNKDTKLKPSLIELTESSGWTKKSGGSEETAIYYYAEPVKKDGEINLFESVRINDSIANEKTIYFDEGEGPQVVDKIPTTGTGTITYEYKYNGYTFNVEAEAQSVQTHNAKEAIKSVWGVDAGSVGIEL